MADQIIPAFTHKTSRRKRLLKALGRRRRPTVMTLGLLATVLLPSSPAPAQGARPPDMTRHRDMIYVTLARVSAERSIPVNASYSATPDDGNVYVTVWLRAVNRNDVQLVLDQGDFAVVTPDGRSYDAGYTTPAPALGARAILDIGGRAGGSITFQVLRGTHHATLRWSPTPESYAVHWSSVSWPLRY